MYCRNCGKEIDDKAVICPACGVPVQQTGNVSHEVVEENNSFLWGILGCCIPVVGLVLFLVWKDTKPKSSKAAGIGALICVACIILLYAFIFFMAFVSARDMHHYYYY